MPRNKDLLLFSLCFGSSWVPRALCPLLASQAIRSKPFLSKLLPWFGPLFVDALWSLVLQSNEAASALSVLGVQGRGLSCLATGVTGSGPRAYGQVAHSPLWPVLRALPGLRSGVLAATHVPAGQGCVCRCHTPWAWQHQLLPYCPCPGERGSKQRALPCPSLVPGR